MGDLLNPFRVLGSAAGKVVADAWTAAMLGLWNAGLWLLRLALNFADSLLTPDVSEHGPGAWLYRVTFWIAGALLLIMAMLQLGVAVAKRDGRSLARVGIGLGQFLVVWGGWIAYGLVIVTAAGGLTRSLMQGLLNVSSWADWQPWTPFTPSDIADGTVATVLGLMGLLLWIAAIGHFLVMLVRSAALMVLMATTPISAAGLVSDTGRAWFWKSLRWFHAAALTPVLMVLVLGVGIQFTTGVANHLTGVQGAVGTAVPGVLLVCVATVSPLALFKLLAFVDPATTSGASLRASMAAVGGLQGLLTRSGGGGGGAAATDDQGRTPGEDGAAGTTTARFDTAVAGRLGQLGPAGQPAAHGLGLITTVGATGAAAGADVTNQMGVGHTTNPPNFTQAGRRTPNDTSTNGADTGDGNGPPADADGSLFDPTTSGGTDGGSGGVPGPDPSGGMGGAGGDPFPGPSIGGPTGGAPFTPPPPPAPAAPSAPPGASGTPAGADGAAAGGAGAADAAVIIA